jgi:hypothetical protein
LAALRADLQPGGSALALLVEREWVEESLDLLAPLQGRVWRQVLSTHLVAELVPEIALEGR